MVKGHSRKSVIGDSVRRSMADTVYVNVEHVREEALREESILGFAAKGATDKQIAHHLGISVDAVDSNWRKIRAKLNAISRTHAVAIWARSNAERSEAELREKAAGALKKAADRTGDATLRQDAEALFNHASDDAPTEIASSWPVLAGRTFGRREELATLRRLLSPERGGKRLVTLWGPGGTGKTRLAIAAAHSLRKRYRENAWYVSLAGVTEPSVIADYALQVIGIRKVIGEQAVDQLAGFFLEQAESCLLVLDNLEHLVGADLNRLCSLLMREVPDLRILATSRRPLGMLQERVVSIPPLSVPEDLFDVDAAKASASVRLFMDRAASNELPVATVAELCQHLDGIPLAIEIAAAGSRKVAVAELLERMKNDAIGVRAKPADGTLRHRSLEQTIDWSYRLLSEEHQKALAALSVFRGGWTLDSASGMFGDGQVRDVLSELARNSLIRQNEDSERYSMHEVVRQFAAARLSPDETDHWRERHASTFANLAQRLGISEDESKALETFRADLGNFRAAIQWCGRNGPPELAHRLHMETAELFESIELYEEAWRHISSILDRSTLTSEQRVDLLSSAVVHSIRVRKTAEGLAYAAECDLLAQQTNQIDQRVFALWARTGLLSGGCQESYEALQHVKSLMQEHPGISSIWGGVDQYVYQSLGLVCLKLGRFDEANELLEAFRNLPGEGGRYDFEADFLGDLAALRGQYSVAREHFMGAREKAAAAKRENSVGFYDRKLGFACLCEGLYEEAAEFFESCCRILDSLELPNTGMCQALLMETYIRMGRMREAAHIGAELTQFSTCEVHSALALLALKQGNKSEALNHSRKAVGKALEMGNVSLIAQCYERRAQVQDRFGDGTEMRRSRRLANDLRTRHGLALWL